MRPVMRAAIMRGGVMKGGIMHSSHSAPIIYDYGVTKENTAHIRNKILAVQAGTDDAIWVSAGDSLTASGTDASFPLGFRATARPHYEAVAFAAQLGVVAEERTLCGTAGKTSTAAYEIMVPEYNFNSGTVSANATMGGRQFQHATLSGADRYTPGGTFNKVRLRYAGPTTGRTILMVASTGASFSIAGDNNFNPKTYELDCAGSATYVDFRAATVAQAVNWHVIECYDDTVKRLSVWNAGWNGADSVDWSALTPASGPIGMLTHVSPDMLLFGIGTNDCNLSRPIATFKANLQTVIDVQLNAGKSVALLGLPPLDPALYTSQSFINTYETAIEDVAILNNIPFVPYRDALGGTYANSLAAGYSYSDGTHITPLGAEKVANDVIADFLSVIMSATV